MSNFFRFSVIALHYMNNAIPYLKWHQILWMKEALLSFCHLKASSLLQSVRFLLMINLVIFDRSAADVLTETNLLLLQQALLLNLRLQKPRIAFFEFHFDLSVLWQTSASQSSTLMSMAFIILIAKHSNSLLWARNSRHFSVVASIIRAVDTGTQGENFFFYIKLENKNFILLNNMWDFRLFIELDIE